MVTPSSERQRDEIEEDHKLLIQVTGNILVLGLLLVHGFHYIIFLIPILCIQSFICIKVFILKRQ